MKPSPKRPVFLFEPNKPNLPMKELLIFLMKNREKEILYQKGQEFYPLYGVKERANQLVIWEKIGISRKIERLWL